MRALCYPLSVFLDFLVRSVSLWLRSCIKPSGYLYLDGQEEREMEWWDEMEAEGGT